MFLEGIKDFLSTHKIIKNGPTFFHFASSGATRRGLGTANKQLNKLN